MARLSVWLALFTYFADVIEATVQVGSIAVGGASPEDHWRYVSKFGMGLGEGSYEFRVRALEPWSPQPPDAVPQIGSRSSAGRPAFTQVDFLVYLDEDWPTVESLPPCDRVFLDPVRREGAPRNAWRPQVAAAGQWSSWARGTLIQRVRPHIWYFALSDCSRSTAAGGMGNATSTLNLEYEFRIRQEGGSELSYEVQHMLPAHACVLLLFSVFMLAFARRCLRCRRDADGTLHPVVWCLACTMALQYVAQALHVLHLWRFRADGVGCWGADALAENLSMSSQVLNITLILLIAQGYTLFPFGAVSSDHLDTAKCVGAVVLLVLHAGLACLGRLEDEDPSKHHSHSGLVGWVFAAVRLSLYIWFMHSVAASQHSCGSRVRPFLQQLRLAGSLYFLAYPALLLLVQAFAPYLRHSVMQCGLLVTQAASDAWLASLFLSRGQYFRVSALGATLLPGCGGAMRKDD